MTFNVYRLMKTSSTFLAPMLCGILLSLPAAAKPKKAKPADDSKLFQKKLSKDEQILHALDRLTFGPRPGDVERVKKIGLKKWIFEQLHPDRMDENPVLEARLRALESLRMTPLEAVQHYPPPQMIRAIANGKQPMPDDLLLRASIERFVTRYKVKQAQAAGVAAPPRDTNADLEPARSLQEVLTPEELAIIRSNTNVLVRRKFSAKCAGPVSELMGTSFPAPEASKVPSCVQ